MPGIAESGGRGSGEIRGKFRRGSGEVPGENQERGHIGYVHGVSKSVKNVRF